MTEDTPRDAHAEWCANLERLKKEGEQKGPRPRFAKQQPAPRRSPRELELGMELFGDDRDALLDTVLVTLVEALKRHDEEDFNELAVSFH